MPKGVYARKTRPVADRLWSRVIKTDSCWLWTGARQKTGHGFMAISRAHGRPELVHRISYELSVGPIPSGLGVLHRCDVPNCVNPAHLYVGDQQDNMRDAKDRSRTATGERHGSHKLTAPQVVLIRAEARKGQSFGSLARAFGVSVSAISDVVNETTWTRLHHDLL